MLTQKHDEQREKADEKCITITKCINSRLEMKRNREM
jgi:hypothetical protein